jgi:predicted dithiol-disulfide oxidoreductase (DUF899 family)
MASAALQALRAQLAQLEADLSDQSHALRDMRSELPWEPVDLPPLHDLEGNPVTTERLFAGRPQLAVLHFADRGPSAPPDLRRVAVIERLYADRNIHIAAVGGADLERFVADTRWPFDAWSSGAFHDRIAHGDIALSLFVHHEGEVHLTWSMAVADEPWNQVLLLVR